MPSQLQGWGQGAFCSFFTSIRKPFTLARSTVPSHEAEHQPLITEHLLQDVAQAPEAQHVGNGSHLLHSHPDWVLTVVSLLSSQCSGSQRPGSYPHLSLLAPLSGHFGPSTYPSKLSHPPHTENIPMRTRISYQDDGISPNSVHFSITSRSD